ncbi:MAG: hypothetical protein ACK4GK_07790 [Ferrovibrio sp.]
MSDMDKHQYWILLDEMFREYIANRIRSNPALRKAFDENYKKAGDLAAALRNASAHRKIGEPNQQSMDEVLTIIRENRELLEESGAFEVFDRCIPLLPDAVGADDLPIIESRIMMQMGSDSVKAEFNAAFDKIRDLNKDKEIGSLKIKVIELEQQLKQMALGEKPKPERKPWMEGAGKMLRGVGIGGADILMATGGLFVGGIPIGIPPETAVLSSINGLGLMLEGWGKLRNK